MLIQKEGLRRSKYTQRIKSALRDWIETHVKDEVLEVYFTLTSNDKFYLDFTADGTTKKSFFTIVGYYDIEDDKIVANFEA